MKKFLMLLAISGFLVSCATSGTPESEQSPNSELGLNPGPSFVEETPAEAKVSDQVAAISSEAPVQPTVMPVEAPLPELVRVADPVPVAYMAPHSDVGRYQNHSEKKSVKKVAKKVTSKKIAKNSKKSSSKVSAKISSKKAKVAKKLSKAQCLKIAKHLKKSTKKEIAMCKIEKRKTSKQIARRS